LLIKKLEISDDFANEKAISRYQWHDSHEREAILKSKIQGLLDIFGASSNNSDESFGGSSAFL